MNAQLAATFRKQLTSDLNGKINLRALYDRDYQINNQRRVETFVVKDVYTLSNTTLNSAVSSSSQLIKTMGFIAGANVDYKGKYIFDGTFRHDGSSLFGEGNRWANVRPRVRRLARVRGKLVLQLPEGLGLPRPCVQRVGRQHAELHGAVRNV